MSTVDSQLVGRNHSSLPIATGGRDGLKRIHATADRQQMLAAGQWRPTAKGNGETIGFHLSSLYSPLGWLPWSATVAEFMEAKESPLRLKNWVNSVLGETWEERGETVDQENLQRFRPVTAFFSY